jgi:hypothetical protein
MAKCMDVNSLLVFIYMVKKLVVLQNVLVQEMIILIIVKAYIFVCHKQANFRVACT